jgi:hypothetical protein
VTITVIPAGAKSCIGPILFALLAACLGHWLGGGAALGRVDAALLAPTLVLTALLVDVLPMRWRTRSRIGTIVLPTALLIALCWAAATWLSDDIALQNQGPQLVFLAAASMGALVSVQAAKVAASKWHIAARLFFVATLAALWWLGSHIALGWAYTPRVAAPLGKTIVLTGLPLRTWPRDTLRLGELRDAAAVVALRTRLTRPPILADGLAPGSVGPDDRLLLAHPLALPPETLVEVDRFVRAGGRAVILADGLSSWPPPYRFGDPRNPPVTSLLTPLLDHWAVRLDAPVPNGMNSDTVTVVHQGHRLTLHSTGHFSKLPDSCRRSGLRPDGQPVIVTCRIGQGTAVLLADADLLFDPLWRPEPLWAAHLRRSDNIDWLAGQLNEPFRPGFWGLRPTWR